MAVIETRNIVKRYETGGETLTALKGIDFAVEPGEFVSIMGPSGSGKTTLLNLLGLLDKPSEGQVLIDDEDVTGLNDRERTRERKQTIGFVFQHFYLIPTLTARENVEVPALFDHDPTVRERAVDLLERMGLGDRLDHKPDELSGGQKQRVAIARSLINEPRVVLADEPTGNLDRETGRKILEEFETITDRDVAVIAVTHDDLVNEYVDRSVELVDGSMGEEIPAPATGNTHSAVGDTDATVTESGRRSSTTVETQSQFDVGDGQLDSERDGKRSTREAGSIDDERHEGRSRSLDSSDTGGDRS